MPLAHTRQPPSSSDIGKEPSIAKGLRRDEDGNDLLLRLAHHGCRRVRNRPDGAERIHLSLADDTAVDQVLEAIAATAPPQAPILDHSTVGPGPTAERSARWAERGRIYLHAPVFMAPANAEAGTGVMLLSGNPEHCALVLPALVAMASKSVNLGPDPGRAAAFKLMGNLGLLAMSAVAGEVMLLAAACGVPAAEAAGLFQVFNPGDVTPSVGPGLMRVGGRGHAAAPC